MPRRALLMAGGGLKVGFQAGVLEVWLDEAGLTFDHADGASGGCFNLAMYCQGMSGRRIADNWRNLDPFLPVSLNWEQYWRLLQAPSLFTYDRFREQVLPFWGIDWAEVRRSERTCTFNVFDFSARRLEVVPHTRMDADWLVASVSLPMWFPPVRIGGHTYIDAVYVTDANVEEAVRRGADEIWAIWTVSTRDEWRDGFVAQYFHIIEAAANANFFGWWRRIEESNRRIAAGEVGEFGRPIALRLLQAEVPVHYLFNLSRDRMAESVNLGVELAREWCVAQGVPLAPRGAVAPPPAGPQATSLRFSETMRGHFALGVAEPEAGRQLGRQQGSTLRVDLTIRIPDADRFMSDPDHRGVIGGHISGDAIGGERPVDSGVFNLLVTAGDPRDRRMLYRLHFRTADGAARTLSGVKVVSDDGGPDIWSDTTTLFVNLYEGTVGEPAEAAAACIGAGVIRIDPLEFLQQLTTFRAEGPSMADRLSALGRFGKLFMGKLWDVYGQRLTEIAPV